MARAGDLLHPARSPRYDAAVHDRHAGFAPMSHPNSHHTSLNRRRFIQIGQTGLLGLSLPQLLAARSATASGAAGSEKSCIFIVLSGGLSHIDTFDPKPKAPRELRGPYGVIPTSVPGIEVADMLPLMAQQAHRYTILRSLSHTEVPHVTAAHMMLSGQMDGSRNNNSPFMGSLVAKFAPSSGSMPSHVWLHNMKTGTNKVPRYESGLDALGHAFAPLRVGYELDNPTNPEFRVREFDPPAGISELQLSERFRLLSHLEADRSALLRTQAGQSFRTFQEKARDLVTGPAARRAFDVNQEPDRLRDRYGRHPLGQYTLMARRLIEAGVRLVTVTGWPGLAEGETTPTVTQVWDMHDNYYTGNDNMYGDGPYGMRWSLPRLDQAVSALLIDLDERGLLDDTLVVLLGEFGRTPKFEGEGRGRGHWPNCYTALLAGGGTRGGTVYGASDAHGAYVASGRPLSPSDIGATLFHALGIPPDTRFGPDGFSLRVSDGEPLLDAFG